PRQTGPGRVLRVEADRSEEGVLSLPEAVAREGQDQRVARVRVRYQLVERLPDARERRIRFGQEGDVGPFIEPVLARLRSQREAEILCVPACVLQLREVLVLPDPDGEHPQRATVVARLRPAQPQDL